MSKTIYYRGLVREVHDDSIAVEIADETACSACSVQSSCSMSGVRTKRIEIPHTSGSYRPGDTVTVVGQTATGLRATFLAYILPLIFLLAILGASASMGASEEQSAVISLSVLTVYYLGIYFFRNKLKQTFTFTIQSP